MPQDQVNSVARIINQNEHAILAEWLEELRKDVSRTGRMTAAELETQASRFLRHFAEATAAGGSARSEIYGEVRAMIEDIARSRAVQGFTPSESAGFIFSLKYPLFRALARAHGTDTAAIARATVELSQALDSLGLYLMEVYQKTREDVIARQQREIAELSTPVVKLAEGILALPLIGTLDSERTQVVMENLLQSLVDNNAEIAIIDITGVPTVDTLVAQHLLKTISAARLMGADCIISGIRPQIAQTMVHLGVELNVVSKSSLADAFNVALRRVGRTVVALRRPATAGTMPPNGDAA